jgi:hypothetical protein
MDSARRLADTLTAGSILSKRDMAQLSDEERDSLRRHLASYHLGVYADGIGYRVTALCPHCGGAWSHSPDPSSRDCDCDRIWRY